MDKYQELSRILQDAHNQASGGKGKERHADGKPFEDQKICVISRWLKGNPCAAPLFQVVKKAVETTRLPPESAIYELYGVVNYAAAAIKLYEEILAEDDAEVVETGVFSEGDVRCGHYQFSRSSSCGRTF